MVYCLVKQC